MDDKKYKIVVSIWGVILIIFDVINLISCITMKANSLYASTSKNVAIITSLVMLMLVVLYLVLALMQMKAGPIIGIIRGVLYIISLNIFGIVLGIGFIVSCASMLKDLSKNNV